MKGLRYLGIFIRDFFIILGFTVACASFFLLLFSIRTIDASLLWQLILVSLAATLPNLVYYSEGAIGRMPMLTKVPAHISLILVLYFFSAYVFKWFNSAGTAFILVFVLFVLLGYVLCFIVIFISESMLARKLNEKLDEYKDRGGGKIE